MHRAAMISTSVPIYLIHFSELIDWFWWQWETWRIVWRTSHHFLSAKSGAGCHYILIISDSTTKIIG